MPEYCTHTALLCQDVPKPSTTPLTRACAPCSAAYVTWTPFTTSGALPSANHGFTTALDPVNQHMLLFGGCTDATVNNVLQAQPGAGNGWLQQEARSGSTPASRYADRAALYEGSSPAASHAGYMTVPGSETSTVQSPESSATEAQWWNPEKWFPQLRNI